MFRSYQRSTFPLVLRCFLIGCVVLLAHTAATAGMYVKLSQYGGHAYGNPGDFPYGNTSNGYGGGSEGSGSSCGASGQITTRLYWVPLDPEELPPLKVVVKEWCNASFFAAAYNGTTPSGSCDNGLGFTPVIVGPAPIMAGPTVIGYGKQGQSTGVRYSIVNGDQIIETTCSPSASAGSPMGPAYCSVYYNVAAEGLNVVMMGGIGPWYAKRYLIGQQAGASLSCGFFGSPSSGLTPLTYNWNAGFAGEPFKMFTATQGSSQFTPLGPETDSQMIFRYKRPSQGCQVSCAVTLQVPPGAKPEGGLSTTTYSHLIQAERPNATISVEMGSIDVTGSQIRLTGLLLPFSLVQVGIMWTATVTTPEDYTHLGAGDWNFTQIAHPYRTRVNNGIAQTGNYNGQSGLDNWWPYAGDWDATGASHSAGDMPNDRLTVQLANGSYRDLDAFTVADSFGTWLLYRPPGTGSCYVPLKRINWYWHAAVTRGPSGWSNPGNDRAWSYDSDYPDFPIWTQVILNSGLNYTPHVP